MLTNDEINAAIAKQRGEYIELHPDGTKEYYFAYTDNWVRAGPLLEDMGKRLCWPDLYLLDEDGPLWVLVWHQPSDYCISEEVGAKLPTVAIARAYHAAFCGGE